jgi:hypothetical protein
MSYSGVQEAEVTWGVSSAATEMEGRHGTWTFFTISSSLSLPFEVIFKEYIIPSLHTQSTVSPHQSPYKPEDTSAKW